MKHIVNIIEPTDLWYLQNKGFVFVYSGEGRLLVSENDGMGLG
jgi:hypothetical protein